MIVLFFLCGLFLCCLKDTRLWIVRVLFPSPFFILVFLHSASYHRFFFPQLFPFFLSSKEKKSIF